MITEQEKRVAQAGVQGKQYQIPHQRTWMGWAWMLAVLLQCTQCSNSQ